MPLNIALLTMLMSFMYGCFWGRFEKRIPRKLFFSFIGVISIAYFYSARNRPDNFITRTVPTLLHPFGERWQRIDALSSLGQFLDRHTPINSVISSPEEATIMYYSKREMVGLLGVSTTEISKMPLQPMHPGNILHRKRAHIALFQKRPDVLQIYEPVRLGNYTENPIDKTKKTVLEDLFDSDKRYLIL